MKSESAHRNEMMLHRTLDGNIRIIRSCTDSFIAGFKFSDEFGMLGDFRSLFTSRKSLETAALDPDSKVVIAIDDEDIIIGYSVLAPPAVHERWSSLGRGVIAEVKAIEVARSWRRFDIAHRMLEFLLDYPEIESMIIYMVGYSWTWDLSGTKKSAYEYRQVLVRLFKPFGFIELPTNEPNITLKEENIFMARIGKAVPPEIREGFKWLRFGIEP